MIAREYDEFEVFCDNCGEKHEEGFHTFSEAVDFIKGDYEWSSSRRFTKTGRKYVDLCGRCSQLSEQ